MVRKSFILNLFSFLLPLSAVYAGDNGNQAHIDAIVRDLFQRGVLQYVPLHGGALADVQRVTIEPSAFVVRKINSNNSFEACINEAIVAEICAQQGIGPRLYAADPAQKLLFLEYLHVQVAPREQFGTQLLLHEFGKLVAQFHAIDPETVKKNALDQYGVAFEIASSDTWVLTQFADIIKKAEPALVAMGLTVDQMQEWYNFFEHNLTSGSQKIVFSHADLHWGNCLYAHGRLWLIDYESSALAPWWYDLGVLGAHFSFFDEQDAFLLEGYFGIDAEIAQEQKEQYQSMKHIAMLFYASNRLRHFNMEDIERAIATNMDLKVLHDAYKNNTFSLASDYEDAQLAIAMIRYVGEKYKAII